jgi:transposase
MKHEQRVVYGGVDTHQDVHVAAVIDEVGTLLGTKSFPTSALGLKSLQRWLTRHGRVAKVGVEGTGTYGLGLQRVLQDAGLEVVEVNRPNRQLRRAKGKSDTVDAESAARAVLAGHATAVPKAHDGIVEAIRVVQVAHTSTKQALQKVDGRIRSLTITAPQTLRVEFTGLSVHARAEHAARLRPGNDHAEVTTATKVALRTLGRQRQLLAADLTSLEAELEHLTTQANPGLRQVPGVGPIVAATLLSCAGDNPERMSSEAAFAALCGVSPVCASSGKTTAVRLNRGGNRHANSALFRVALVRMSHRDQATMDYLARRTREGKSKKAILRCLKRAIARQIYRHLVNPQPAVRTDDLRARRQAIKRPMREVSDALNTPIMAISCLERGTNHDADLATRYRNWLQQQENAA